MRPYIGVILVMVLLILPMAYADIPYQPGDPIYQISDFIRSAHLQFAVALILTITIEAIVLFLILHKERKASDIAVNAVVASTLTLPFVWFVFGGLALPWAVKTGMAEGFAVLVEAGFYKLAFRGMALEKALMASFICNAASFIIGLIIL